jgi:hypothetical protein
MLLKSSKPVNFSHTRKKEVTSMIHPLTQIVLSILGFLELCLQSLKTGLAGLKETHAFHVRHPVSVFVVDTVGEIDLMRQEC